MSNGNATPIISDAFVQKVMGPVTLGLFALTAVPGIACAAVVAGTDFFGDVEPPFVPLIIGHVLSFKGLPGGLSAVAAQALPALTAALCFSRTSGMLNWVGKASFMILLLSVCVAAFGLLFVNPENTTQAENITSGAKALSALYNGSYFSLSSALTYLFLLAGLKIKLS
jgi:hypothetical protein